jgi:hypothetical protein
MATVFVMATSLASIKASWKLYKHFFFVTFFFSLLSEATGGSLLGGGGRASGLVSESAGPKMSLPLEKNGKVKASQHSYL